LAARLGLRRWVFTDSGRSALTVVLQAYAGSRPGRDEVIVPAYTSYTVAAAVVRAGLRVRVCDIEADALGICARQVEQALTSKTLCIVAHHLFGIPSRIDEVSRVAKLHGIPVVEDAAQALGVTCPGGLAGTRGDVAIFSLSRGKPLPAGGGGVIGTDDEDLAERCRLLMGANDDRVAPTQSRGFRSAAETALMSMFIRPSLYWLPASLPFLRLGDSIYDPSFGIAPMSKFQERLAAQLLPNLATFQGIRRENARRLREALGGLNGFRLIWPPDESGAGFLRLAVALEDGARRARVLGRLWTEGLGASIAYPAPISGLSELGPHIVGNSQRFPVAEGMSKSVFTLPTHQWVGDRDVERIRVSLGRAL
jgi:dTDP-4-amino-4,6-dideoxygalactose transaminase